MLKNLTDADENARMWEAEKGLGYDNIQCSKATKVSKEDAEDMLNEFKDKMNEAQLEDLQDYLEKYDGCFCKNHLKQDFFMPNGWWLGKVNEKRPEKPMLPKGSFKDGYQDDYKDISGCTMRMETRLRRSRSSWLLQEEGRAKG